MVDNPGKIEIPDLDGNDRLAGISFGGSAKESDDTRKAKPQTRGLKTQTKQFYRRFLSERQMEEALEWELEPAAAYHVISGGDVDSLSFLKHILRQQPLEYLLFSTWCMALQDIEEIERYMALGRVKRLDSYVGEIFKGSYGNEYVQLCKLHERYGGRVAIFRNHAKIYCGFGDKYDFVVESSANINTNPRTENTCVTTDTGLAYFCKEFFDGIVSFERNFDSWEPYIMRRRKGRW